MNTVIITQEDYYVIPDNIQKILKLKYINIKCITIINSKSSLINKKKYFLKGIGLLQSIKLGLILFQKKILNFLDISSNTVLFKKRYSLEGISIKNNIDFIKSNNPNDKYYISKIKKINPDLIISFSCPIIFKKELINIAKYGCINLHCSYLPKYSGLMPSFWVLYNKEKNTGVSIHLMDNKIDNGSILMRKKILIPSKSTVYSLIKLTKSIGGNLMCKVLSKINKNGFSNLKLIDNNDSDRSYFSWPKNKDFQIFKKEGGKFI